MNCGKLKFELRSGSIWNSFLATICSTGGQAEELEFIQKKLLDLPVDNGRGRVRIERRLEASPNDQDYRQISFLPVCILPFLLFYASSCTGFISTADSWRHHGDSDRHLGRRNHRFAGDPCRGRHQTDAHAENEQR